MTDPTKVCPREKELLQALGELAGFASMCWTPAPTGVFDSTLATEGVDRAFAEICALYAAPTEAAQGEVEVALQAAIHALRSYQYGNGAPDLAEEVADRCERALAPKAKEQQ